MGLSKWLAGKAVLYLVVFGICLLVSEVMGWTPQSIKDLIKWFADNFLLITILLISFMTFIIMLRLTSKPRRGQPT